MSMILNTELERVRNTAWEWSNRAIAGGFNGFVVSSVNFANGTFVYTLALQHLGQQFTTYVDVLKPSQKKLQPLDSRITLAVVRKRTNPSFPKPHPHRCHRTVTDKKLSRGGFRTFSLYRGGLLIISFRAQAKFLFSFSVNLRLFSIFFCVFSNFAKSNCEALEIGGGTDSESKN